MGRGLEAKIKEREMKISHLLKSRSESEDEEESLRNPSASTETYKKSSRLDSDKNDEASMRSIKELKSQLSQSTKKIDELQSELLLQNENYDRIVDTLRRDISNLTREKSQVESELK